MLDFEEELKKLRDSAAVLKENIHKVIDNK